MIETLISSKTRVKLLLKFFLNSGVSSYLRNLESEFSESTNAIRIELNKFEKAGMLLSRPEGNKKIFWANTGHPFFTDLNNIVRKHIGIDRIITDIAEQLGNLEKAYLAGHYANGTQSDTIELVLIGNIDQKNLKALCQKATKSVHKQINYEVFKHNSTFDKLCEESKGKYLLLWEQ
jgi:hypothetical protein